MSRENLYGLRNKLFSLENDINFSVFVFVFEDTKEIFLLLIPAVSLLGNTITFLPYLGHINPQERLANQCSEMLKGGWNAIAQLPATPPEREQMHSLPLKSSLISWFVWVQQCLLVSKHQKR